MTSVSGKALPLMKWYTWRGLNVGVDRLAEVAHVERRRIGGELEVEIGRGDQRLILERRAVVAAHEGDGAGATGRRHDQHADEPAGDLLRGLRVLAGLEHRGADLAGRHRVRAAAVVDDIGERQAGERQVDR